MIEVKELQKKLRKNKVKNICINNNFYKVVDYWHGHIFLKFLKKPDINTWHYIDFKLNKIIKNVTCYDFIN